jgi:DNA-binding transcriptional ArsR family regulator
MQGVAAPARGSRTKDTMAAAQDLSLHFEGLAHPTRISIIERLAATVEVRVSELAESCKVSQPRMSWHLRQLRRSQLIRTRREGREVYCRLDRDSITSHLRSFVRLLQNGGDGVSEPKDIKDFIEVAK